MVNLASGKGISRRAISKRETVEYKAFLTLHGLDESEISRVGNIEQQANGEYLLTNGHVFPTYIPEPILSGNQDWLMKFETLSQKGDDKYDETITLSVDLENSTPQRRIYVFEKAEDMTPDTEYNIKMKGRAGKSKHSIAAELWIQEQLPILLQDPVAQEIMDPMLKSAGLNELLLQKRYNLFLDDFKKYCEQIDKNRKLRAAQRKSAKMSWLIERGRESETLEVTGEHVTLYRL